MKQFVLGLAGLTIALAGCTAPMSPEVTRASAPAFELSDDQVDMAHMQAQADALDHMTKDLVRKSTMKGTAIGALAGCGLAAMTGAGKNSCLKGALAGGVVGGIAGHVHGKAQVEKRVEIVSLSRVMPSIRAASGQASLVNRNVPGLIKAQNREIERMQLQVARGEMSKQQFDGYMTKIRADRQSLTNSLALSADQARQAREALEIAEDQGQQGLSWYIHTVSQVEEDAVSARSAISLL